MTKHVNYQQGVLTIDPHPVVDASVTNVREVISAFQKQSDAVLSASIGTIETLDQLVYLEEHSVS